MEHQGLQENGLEMGDELALQFSDMGIKDPNSGSGIDEYGSDMHHMSDSPSAVGCNLIVNYLPHDIDDISLKVSETKSNCQNFNSQITNLAFLGPLSRLRRYHHDKSCS